MTTLTPELAQSFVTIALGHVGQEYPNKLDHVMESDADAKGPRALHPIFFGSFDWHSCVHAYWMMARLTRLFPDIPAKSQVETLFAERISEHNVAAECAYLARPSARGFERPYGWAWALALQAELERQNHSAAPVLKPMAEAFAARFKAFLPLCDYPIRTGVHSSTAFALTIAADYQDEELFTLMRDKASSWYGPDKDAQAWEPSQEDFLSPTLMQAACMRRFLSQQDFKAWFASFLPRADQGEPANLFEPARISDRSDGKIAHLDGLNFSRAWCWRSIASAFDESAPIAQRARDAAETHIAASLPHVAGDYMGEHWLATFATLALEQT